MLKKNENKIKQKPRKTTITIQATKNKILKIIKKTKNRSVLALLMVDSLTKS